MTSARSPFHRPLSAFALAIVGPLLAVFSGLSARADTPTFSNFAVDTCLPAGGGSVQQVSGGTIYTQRPSFSVLVTASPPTGSPTGLNGTCGSLPEPQGNTTALQGLWKLEGNGTDSSTAGNNVFPVNGYSGSVPQIRNLSFSFYPWSTGVSMYDGFESGGFGALPWTTPGGTFGWTISFGGAAAGFFRSNSTNISDGQTACLQVTRTFGVSGNVNFQRTVDSEGGFDFLRFYVDGVQQQLWSGSVAWGQASQAVSAGTRTLKWCYTKDGSISVGADEASIDEVTFIPDSVAPSANPVGLDNTDFTVETWARWLGGGNNTGFQTLLIDCEAGATDKCLHIGLDNSAVPSMRFWNDDRAASVGIGDGSWHHLIFMLTGTVKSLWIDGVRRDGATSGTQAAYTGAASTVHLGGWPGSTNSFAGLMGPTSIYRRALSVSEIQSRYRGQIFKLKGSEPLDGNLSDAYCTAPPGNGVGSWGWGFGTNRTLGTGGVTFEFASLSDDDTYNTTTFNVTVDQTTMGAPPSPVVSGVTSSGATWTVPTWSCDAGGTNNSNVKYRVNRDWTTPLNAYTSRAYTAALSPNTVYGVNFQATYTDSAPGSSAVVGPSAAGGNVFATTLANTPSQPNSLTVTGPQSVTVTTGLNGNPAHTAIDVEASATGAGGPFAQVSTHQFFDVAGANRAISGLARSSRFYFQSTAQNLNSVTTAGSGSNGSSMVTQPNAPVSLFGATAAGAGECPKTQIRWSWGAVTMGSGAGAQYNVTRDIGTPVSGTIGAVLTYLESGLTPGSSYDTKVRAFDSGASAAPDIRFSPDSSVASFTTGVADIEQPLAPTGVAASNTTINWSWPAVINACAPTYKDIDATTLGLLFTTAPNVTSWSQGGLTVNSLSSIRVRADDAFDPDESPNSTPGSAYTLANPPTGMTLTAVTTGSVTVGWSSTNPGYTRFGVTYSPDNFATITQTLYTMGDNFTGTSVGIGGLTAGTNYAFRVIAYSGRNTDAFGNIPTAPLNGSVWTRPQTPVVTGVGSSSTQIDWTWPAVTGATGYRLYTAPGGPLLIDTPLLIYPQSGLTINTQYGVEIEAYNVSGTGIRSSPVYAYTLAVDPVAFTVTAVSTRTASFSWGPNGNPPYTFYEVGVAIDPAFTSIVNTLNVNATIATATGLYPETTYYARVRSVSGSQGYGNFVPSAAGVSTMTLKDLAITTTSVQTSAYIAPAGTVGQWQFDESTGVTAADSSGFANTAFLTCLNAACVSTPTWVAGPPGMGTAAAYPGLNNSLTRVPDTAGYNFTDKITVSAWVKPTSLSQQNGAGIVVRGNGGGAENFALDVSGSLWRFMPKTGFLVSSTNTISLSNWTHLIGVYDSAVGSATLYVNGRPASTILGVPARTAALHDISIGNRQSAAGAYDRGFLGHIESVRVEHRALNAAEALAEYQGNFTSTVAPISPNNGIQIGLPPNAFGGPATLFVSIDPVQHPILISPASLNAGIAAYPTGYMLVPNSMAEIVPLVNGAPFVLPLGSSATLSMPYLDVNGNNVIDNTNPPLAASAIKMFTLNTTINRWEMLPTFVNASARRVTAFTPHFSVFAMFAPVTIGTALAQVRVYPIPWKPGSNGRFDAPGITFDTLPVNGTIRIMNLAGERIREFTFDGSAAGAVVWNGMTDHGRRAASGVYFARIVGDNGAASLLKFAIER